MNNVLLSISCITYNHKKFLHECLNSFLMQKTTFSFEILIHDDASTDGTREILKEYELKFPEKIKVFYQKENQFSQGKRGFNAKFNYPRARGKYIALCEGDDYWTDPYKLQKQVDFLEANPEFVLTYHDAMIISADGEIIKKNKLKDRNKRDFSSVELQKAPQILTLSMCFRNVIKQFPTESYRVTNGDSFLISLLGDFGKGKYLHNITPACYRVQNGGVWSTIDREQVSVHQAVTYFELMRYYNRIGNLKLSKYYKFRLRNAHLSLVKQSSKRFQFAKIYMNSQKVLKYSELKNISTYMLIFKSIINGLIKK